jgi:ribosomal protein S18 acetylase RimI-like enzyme
MLMPEQLTITSPDSADRDAVIRLLAEQLAEHRIETGGEAIVAAVDGIMVDDRRGFLLVAKEAGTAVAVAYVSFIWTLEHGGKSCWLEELYVLPKRRGCGIGSKLLASVLERARSGGCAAVDLEVDSEHERAANLYSRYGFRPLSRGRWVLGL